MSAPHTVRAVAAFRCTESVPMCGATVLEVPTNLRAYAALCVVYPMGCWSRRSPERSLPSRARAFAWDEVGRVTFPVSDARRRLFESLPMREHLIMDDGLLGRRGRVVFRPAPREGEA